MKTKPAIRIGIDPAFRKSGFAVCIIDENKEAQFRTFKNGLLDFLSWLWNDSPDNALVTVENSNLQNITFDMRGSKAVIAKKSRNVGKNQAASEITVQACIVRWGKNRVQNISPRQKGGKWTDKEFKAVVRQEGHKLYGYTGKEDYRDAYQLALHRSFSFA